jgi:small subunit ribosomal protein S9
LSTSAAIGDFKAAPPIDFDKSDDIPARILPASPAYFTGTPKFTDHLLNLERIQSKYAFLPTVPAGEAPRMAWLKLPEFRNRVGEMVPTAKYRKLLNILKQLNRIHPGLVPDEVKETMEFFLRPGNPYQKQCAPATLDDMGRAKGVGRRKTSSAVVWLVEGDGEVMINGKSLLQVFPRIHDRESALWALRCTNRLDKYNVWALVQGGGVTGQAESITLGVARALLVHEPALKPVLRRGMFRLAPIGFSHSQLCLHYELIANKVPTP